MSDETINIGREAGTPATSDYDRTAVSSAARLTGCRSIPAKMRSHNHFISPEERLRFSMARQ
jgi:arylsulfatase